MLELSELLITSVHRVRSIDQSINQSINRSTELEAGDKLKWSWEARDNEMIIIVRKANGESIAKAKLRKRT